MLPCAFEAPNPEYWCPHGYAVMFVDPRGLWWSEGEGVLFGSSEQRIPIFFGCERATWPVREPRWRCCRCGNGPGRWRCWRR